MTFYLNNRLDFTYAMSLKILEEENCVKFLILNGDEILDAIWKKILIKMTVKLFFNPDSHLS